MSTSVRTKARKKQPKHDIPQPDGDPAIERALLALESACLRSQDDGLSENEDAEYWQHRFRNIVTPVSLALAESKGPRQFHYHYRHSAKDDAVLEPVLEPTHDQLARVCKHALEECAKKLVGIRDRELIDRQRRLESALRAYLLRYEDYRAEA